MGVRKYANGFRVTIHPDALDEPLRWKKPRMIFVVSMGDLFHEEVPEDFIRSVFEAMARAPWHTFQVLTKRAERMAELLTRPDWPIPPNVWVGVTAENQKMFDKRVPFLMRIHQASVRFVSAEPLLGPIHIPPWCAPGTALCTCTVYDTGWPVMEPDSTTHPRCPECGTSYTRHSGIDWLIVGGESGHGARPMKVEWVRSLRDQAAELGIPFFFKQWGGTNKKHSGRLLDGKIYDEMPRPRLYSTHP